MLAGAVLGLAMLFLLRRYPGIHHDSILYLGQGLMQKWPGLYGQDLFFLYGSQGNYSFMPWLLGHAFSIADPPDVFMLGTFASMMLFAAASWFCVGAMLPARQRYWGWLGALCLPSIYGMVSIFSYNEPFLTSRPIAEAMCLLGLGVLLRGRWLLGVVSLAGAAAFHPLQAIAAALVIWPWLVMHDRRWIHAAWLLAPILVLAFAGVAPFDGLFQRVDDAWYAELRYSQQIFVTQWSTGDLKVLGFDVLVLVQAYRLLDARFGKWCLAALVGLAAGLAASLLLVDGLHLVLPGGLQLWRSHWLAHWFSMAAIGALLFQHLRASQRVGALLLVLTALLAWGETSWGWLVMAGLYMAWPHVPGETRSRLEPMLARVFLLAVLLLFASHAINELHWFREADYRFDRYPIDRRLLVFPALSLGLPLLAVALWERVSDTDRAWLFYAALLPAVLLVAWVWDSRAPIQRQIEAAAFRTNVFGIDLPTGAQVFWYPESLVSVWMVLQRPSFYSPGQLAGQMFSRQTALEGKLREDRMLPLMNELMQCQAQGTSQAQQLSCRISDSGMRRACGDPGPAPDFLVLPYAQTRAALGTWTLNDPVTGELFATYRLYRCSEAKRDGRRSQARRLDAVDAGASTR